MRVLAVSSAYGGCRVALLESGALIAEASISEEMGLAAALPALVDRVLDRGGRALDLVGVVVGPGSFTGLRAGISVAAGIGLALGVPIVGVTVAEALAQGVGEIGGRPLWTAIEARRGHVFVDQGKGFHIWPESALPSASGRVAVCGNAANLVAATLAARGGDVMLTQARQPHAAHVAQAALRRHAGELPPLDATPIYVDPPQAKLPAGGLRAAPV